MMDTRRSQGTLWVDLEIVRCCGVCDKESTRKTKWTLLSEGLVLAVSIVIGFIEKMKRSRWIWKVEKDRIMVWKFDGVMR